MANWNDLKDFGSGGGQDNKAKDMIWKHFWGANAATLTLIHQSPVQCSVTESPAKLALADAGRSWVVDPQASHIMQAGWVLTNAVCFVRADVVPYDVNQSIRGEVVCSRNVLRGDYFNFRAE